MLYTRGTLGLIPSLTATGPGSLCISSRMAATETPKTVVGNREE
jgi:hypothetical protein